MSKIKNFEMHCYHYFFMDSASFRESRYLQLARCFSCILDACISPKRHLQLHLGDALDLTAPAFPYFTVVICIVFILSAKEKRETSKISKDTRRHFYRTRLAPFVVDKTQCINRLSNQFSQCLLIVQCKV